MIEAELLSIFGTTEEDGERVDEFVNQFRRGRDASELLELLDSSHVEVVSVAAWILGELAFDRYNADCFLSRLRGLLDHPCAEVRFHAFGALFPALDLSEPATQAVLEKMRRDPEPGNRHRADVAAARLSSM